MEKKPFSITDAMNIDPEMELKSISKFIRTSLKNSLKRRGLVIGLSGGIDSTVSACIAVKAIGTERVVGLLMPERESDEDTLRLSQLVAEHLGIHYIHEDISSILESVGFYKRYIEAVRHVIPDYGANWKSKIVLPDNHGKNKYNLFMIVAQSPEGKIIKKSLPLQAYLEIVAATNFKQRTRKMLEYYHADRLNYAVAGTPNRLEYELGFFVKYGDGSADIKPIAHLYKCQVYQLAKYLKAPAEIIARKPSTDTYTLDQGQDEFFFQLSFEKMDHCLYGCNKGVSAAEVAEACKMTVDQVNLVYEDIKAKKNATKYLHLPPLSAV